MADDEKNMQISADSPGQTQPPVAPGGRGAANPAALTLEQLARATGLPLDTVRRHVEDGAPTDADGCVNLIRYAAWLNRQMGSIEKNDGD